MSSPPPLPSYQDLMIDALGENGRSQFLIFLATKAPSFFAAWSMVMMSFAGAQPKWWSVSTVYNATTNKSFLIEREKVCPGVNDTVRYDDSIYTIVSEWNLICKLDWIPTMITTVQMIGVLVGAAVVGQLGDWIGRRKSILIVYTINIVFIFVQGFATSWQMMVATIFLVGFGLGGYLCICNVFMLEFISTRYRTVYGVIPFWAAGVVCFGGLFKLLPNWRHLCIANAVIGAPLIIALFFTPESVRWLVSHHRVDEARQVIGKLSKLNKRQCPDLDSLETIVCGAMENDGKTYTYWNLVSHPATRWKAFIFAFMWFYCTFAYYGITLGVSRLAGDIVVNMALMGIGEVLGMVMVWSLSKCLGRRNTTIFLMAMMALTSFAITIAYFADTRHYERIKGAFAITSRFFLSSAWQSLILFNIESFPTQVRAVAFGFSSVAGRIGGIVSPQNKTLDSIVDHLPFTVNGSLALVSCFLCMFLYDTYSIDLPDILEDKKPKKKVEDEEKNSEKTLLVTDSV